MVLIVVAVGTVTSFAFLLQSFQSQALKSNNQITNAQNENLQVASIQLYPPRLTSKYIGGLNLTVSNLNTQPSGLVGIQVNGNYSAFGSINNTEDSPFSVLSNGNYVLINATQVIGGKQTLNLEINLSSTTVFSFIPRTSAISIQLITAAQDVFSFSIHPPVAQFVAQNISPSDELLNASSSFSPDTGIQTYTWSLIGLNMGGGVSFTTLSGQFVQYFPPSTATLVILTVADNYGLESNASQIVNTPVQPVGTTTTSPPPTSVTTTGQPPPTCGNNWSQDVQMFVCPYLNQLERIRAVLMRPYMPGQSQSYGFDSTIGLTCGGNIEPSPALGNAGPTHDYTSGGYHDTCVGIDNNFEGSKSLDYFNNVGSILTGIPGWTVSSPASNIYGTVTNLLDNMSWNGVGGCPSPFTQYSYPSGFQLLDRREAEYGFAGMNVYRLLNPQGINIGGIGNNCGTGGQTWYLPTRETASTTTIVTVFPSNQTPGMNSDLEELSFVIDNLYAQCVAFGPTSPSCAQWRTAYTNAMSQYPFPAPRQALHFIQATRATGAWMLTGITVHGLTPLQMLEITIKQIFTPSTQTGPMGVGGAVGPDGGLYQQWGGRGSSDTPEPNFQAMVAFDPNMPNWFTSACYTTPASCLP